MGVIEHGLCNPQTLLHAPGKGFDFVLTLSLIHIFSFMLVDDAKPLRLCKHCQKVFLGSRANSVSVSYTHLDVYKRQVGSRQ